MITFYWAKADRALYYVRDNPGGRGPKVGKVWRADMGHASGSFYNILIDYDGHFYSGVERASPITALKFAEARMREFFPDAEFVKEGF